jgi:hypothetical protein
MLEHVGYDCIEIDWHELVTDFTECEAYEARTRGTFSQHAGLRPDRIEATGFFRISIYLIYTEHAGAGGQPAWRTIFGGCGGGKSPVGRSIGVRPLLQRSRHSATAALAGKPIAAERNRNPLPPEGGLARAGVTTRKCYFCVDR